MARIYVVGFETEGPPQNDNGGLCLCLLHLSDAKTICCVATPSLLDSVFEAFKMGGVTDWSLAQKLTGSYMQVDRPLRGVR